MAEKAPTTTGDVYKSYARALRQAPFGGDAFYYNTTTAEGYGARLDDYMSGIYIDDSVRSAPDRRKALKAGRGVIGLLHVEFMDFEETGLEWQQVGATYTLFAPKHINSMGGHLLTRAHKELGEDIDPDEILIQKLETFPDQTRQVSHVLDPLDDPFIASLYEHTKSLKKHK